LIIVIIIVGILIALLLPTVRRGGGEPARRFQCNNNLKQIGLALHNYHDIYGAFPPSYTTDTDGNPLHSWRTLLLPFLDQKPLYETIDLSKPWNDPANAEAYAATFEVYRCPSTNLEPGQTTYLALVTPDSFLRLGEPRTISESSGDISNDMSNTVMVIEVDPGHAIHWMDPLDADEATFMSFDEETEFAHTGGSHGLFADGSVQFLSFQMPEEERRELSAYDASEPESK
jgi:prepilin-type processing-associated H-X9-DG protein